MDGRSCEENKRYGIYFIGIYQDLLLRIAATVNDLFGSTVSFSQLWNVITKMAAKDLELTGKLPSFYIFFRTSLYLMFIRLG